MFNPSPAFLLVKKLKSAPRALHKESRLQSAPKLLINALWLVCLGAQYKAIINIIIIVFLSTCNLFCKIKNLVQIDAVKKI